MRTINDIAVEQQARVQKMARFHDSTKAWLCNECDSEIQQTTGYATVLDGPGHMSGSGKVLHYAYPYCPKCEVKPNTPRDTVDTD